MTLGTMDGKTDQQPSVTVIQTEGSSDSAGGKKSRVTRKYVIIGVTCALVVAIVIAGILVGVKFHLDSTSEIVMRTLEFNKGNNQKVKEDVGADVKENYVRYHLKDEDSEVTVIEDFNRELRVMKVRQPEGSKCYIAVLNSTDSALPQAVLNATATDEVVETEKHHFDVSETSIKDLSMLGTHGKNLCYNLDVHWMTQTCGDAKNSTLSANENEDDHGREKRAVRCYFYIRRLCYWRRYCYYRYGRFYCYWRYWCYYYRYRRCYYY